MRRKKKGKRGKILPAVIWSSVLTRVQRLPTHAGSSWSIHGGDGAGKKQHNEVVTGPNECPRARRVSRNIRHNESALPPWSPHPSERARGSARKRTWPLLRSYCLSIMRYLKSSLGGTLARHSDPPVKDQGRWIINELAWHGKRPVF